MPLLDPFTGNLRHQIDELVDRYHFLRPNIDGAGKVGTQQPYSAFDALVDVQERAGLFTIAPHLDFVVGTGHRDFSANRSWRLLATARPSPLRSEYIMIASDMSLQREISSICKVQSLAKKLFPPIFAIRRRWVSRILRADRIQRVVLVVGRVNASFKLIVAELCITSASCSPVKI